MSKRPNERGAFTLVELLVIIAIIALLLALSASAVLRFTGSQQVSTTKTELAALQAQLDNRWRAEYETFNKENPNPTAWNYIIANLAGADTANTTARARVIYVKLRQRQTFPMTFDEALNPAPLPPLAAYKAYLNGLGITGSTPQTLPFESAVCLLMALSRAPGAGGVSDEDLGPGVLTADFPVTLRNGSTVSVKGLVDAWRSPLLFCRWPTDLPDLNPAGPARGKNDPVDPSALLNHPAWVGTTAYTPYALAFQYVNPATQAPPYFIHKVPLHPANGPQTSYRLRPVIGSAGPDRTPGVDPYTFASQGLAANDNIYSATLP